MVGTANGSIQFDYLPKILNGGFAGIVGVSCVFPMDLVKTRLQNQQIGPNGKGIYTGILDCGRKTWRSGGVSKLAKFRGLYSGSGVNILLITPEKAIKLVVNDFFRYKLSTSDGHLSRFRGMLAGGGAGFCQIVVTTPMELLKIQMQDAGRTGNHKRISATSLALKLVRNKGLFGLYKGVSATMARDVVFSVLYFPLFAELDALGPRKTDGSGDAVFWSSLTSGLIAGAIASFVVTPLDVIKTRLQLIKRGVGEKHYSGIGNAFITILRSEGWPALFKGAVCRMLVMAPLFGIAQTVYYIGVAEWTLGRKKQGHV